MITHIPPIKKTRREAGFLKCILPLIFGLMPASPRPSPPALIPRTPIRDGVSRRSRQRRAHIQGCLRRCWRIGEQVVTSRRVWRSRENNAGLAIGKIRVRQTRTDGQQCPGCCAASGSQRDCAVRERANVRRSTRNGWARA